MSGPWRTPVENDDQASYELSVCRWIALANQPLRIVDMDEFHQVFIPPSRLIAPNQDVIKQRFLFMAEQNIDETRTVIKNLHTRVSLAVRSWASESSAKDYPATFVSIYMHYAPEGRVEKRLLNFCEVERETETIEDVVWRTLEMYGLKNKVLAIMMDNASRNDMLMEDIVERCKNEGVPFDTDSRLRCFCDSVYSAATEFLETVLFSSVETELLPIRSPGASDCEGDIEIAAFKLRRIIQATLLCPQEWTEAAKSLNIPQPDPLVFASENQLLSSTFAMFGLALRHCSVIEEFLSRRADLQRYRMTASDWDAISLANDLVTNCCLALNEMRNVDTEGNGTLSDLFGVYAGLGRSVSSLMQSSRLQYLSDRSKRALVDFGHKLTDHYFRRNASPLYSAITLLNPRMNLLNMLIDARHPDEFELILNGVLYVHDFLGYMKPLLGAAPQSELSRFLALKEEDRQRCRDALEWWNVHKNQYPHLYRLALELLSVPGESRPFV
ncbi:hypothetical protein V5O48_003790 [Marasmius crinis-equi]|uniref:HAT C-terminal dimerisation domain-containing protein n=1 Tax=Marasmius crinis-equi TaxID=585013 RepID=A0ABR3FSV2_9AGAR